MVRLFETFADQTWIVAKKNAESFSQWPGLCARETPILTILKFEGFIWIKPGNYLQPRNQ